MAYLGNAPARSFISFERQVFTIVNSQTAYTLDHSVNNENDIRLVINNIVQEPGSGKAYTASGTTLTLSAALVNGTDEMYCVFLGRAVATNKPGAGSVGTTELAATSVTAAKLNNDIISGTTALATAPADTDEFLISDAGTLKRIDYSLIKSTPGRVLIKEVDISGVAAVSFVNGTSDVVFDTTYDKYQLTWSNVKVVGDEKIRLEAMSSGSALTSGYVTGQSGSVSGTATGESGVTAAFWETYGDMESGDICFGVANFYNVGVSSSKPSAYGQYFHKRSTGTFHSMSFSGVYDTAISNFDGITITDLGGPNIASGKFKLYGIT